MDLLSEIRKLKSKWQDPILDSAGVENPIPYHDRAYQEVMDAIECYCRHHRVSRAEFLEDLRRKHEDLVERFLTLSDAVDCDVFGKWCEGTLTEEELQKFYQNVEEWRTTAMTMLKQNEG